MPRHARLVFVSIAALSFVFSPLTGLSDGSFSLPYQIDFSSGQGYGEGSLLGQPAGSTLQWRDGNPTTPPDALVVNEALFMSSDGNGGKSRHQGRWAVFSFPRQTSGILSASWDWRYLGSDQWGIDAGFSISDSSNFTNEKTIQTKWDRIGAMVLMKHGQPYLEACNGDGQGGREYNALNRVNFADGGLLRMRMEIDIHAQTYDLFATPEGKREVAIARNNGFRRSSEGLDSIVLWENGQLAGSGMSIDNIVLAKGTKTEESPIRCAVYTRSLPDEIPSTEMQRKIAASYIQKHQDENWALLPGQFNDPGFGGADSDRPAYIMLLDAVKKGEIDCIVVQHLDRLTDSLQGFCLLLQQLKERNVRLVSTSQGFDSGTDEGRKMLDFLFSFHSRNDGYLENPVMVDTGDWWTYDVAVPGFDTESNEVNFQTNKIRLIPKPNDADNIQYVFDTFLTCQSSLQTAYFLNEVGITATSWIKQGKPADVAPFTAKRVEAILRNPTYLGLTENISEPLVDRETFDEAAQLLDDKNAGAEES